MKHAGLLAAALALLLTGAGQAQADLIYTNGPINGTITAVNIVDSVPLVSDSFIPTKSATLTYGTAGLWVSQGSGVPTQVSWAIGTSVFGTDVATGMSSLSNVLYSTVPGYNVDASIFAISGSVTVGTTYWLSLWGATLGGEIFWDENNGPSEAHDYNGFSVPSESFSLYDGPVPVTTPEPSTLTMLSIATTMLASYVCWRRWKLAVA